MLGKLNCYVTRVGVFLIAAALIGGIAGCSGGYNPPPSQNLEIRDWYDLDAVRNNLAGNHTLMNDLNSTTPGYEELAGPTANGGKGWEPIGTFVTGVRIICFTGTFDGQGHEIRDLFINRPDESLVGLFVETDRGCVIRDVGIVNVTVTGGNATGGLVGAAEGTVSYCYCSGEVAGNKDVGGLVGVALSNSTLTDCYFTGNVLGNLQVGGLTGRNHGTASNCHSTGNVTGVDAVGGLVGSQSFGIVSSSYSTGSVTGNSSVGGLVGSIGSSGFSEGDSWVVDSYFSGSVSGNASVGGLVGENQCSVSNSYSAGSVSGLEYVGGLVGRNSGPVSNSYSSSDITGDSYVGGLAGENGSPYYYLFGTVSNSYSTGSVTGTFYVGGLVGANSCNVTTSFWDTETSGQAASAGGTGKNTTEMQDMATFSGAEWNITAVALNETNSSYIWNIVNNVTYPFLSWQAV